jgi:imidazolonepropionase-like amidohydrolase
MTLHGDVLKDATVVIKGNRIESITTSAPPNKSARVIDARGKWLMPALADMHVHIENDRLLRLYLQDQTIPAGTVRTADALLPYVANGVLQVAVLTAMPETIAQRDEVESGRVLGPHIALAAMIDGAPPIWPIGMTRVAATPSDGRQAVRDAFAEGYEMIKVYSRLDLATFLAIVDEARKLKMRVLGHIPHRGQGTTDKFFVPGFDMVVHAEEFAQQTEPPALQQVARYAQLAKENGTWLTATLTTNERIVEETKHPETLKSRAEIRCLHPRMQTVTIDQNPYTQQSSPARNEFLERIAQFNSVLVRAFAAAGVPIVAGTDSLVYGVVPGFALHDELEALARAGLSNRAVLESATRLPAEWLGTIQDRGEVAVGKRADLLLLDADPLTDVANTRRISAVIVSGQYHSRADLDARMKDQLKCSLLTTKH